eukprot:gene9440-11107_t
MGETMQVPYAFLPKVNKNVTTLLTAEKSKLKFALNTAISVMKHSGGAGAFALLCVDCKDGEGEEWGSKGLHVIGSQSLLDMSVYAFRTDGPMPHTSVAESGDMRRHSVHMLYREWIKANLLENGLSVFLVDIDIAFTSVMPFFTAKEDVVLEAHWPADFRRNWYAYQFYDAVWVVLNNGVALFTATPAMISFSREFMGMIVHSVVGDFGFAQTSFVKHLSDLKLQLTIQDGHLVGATSTNLTLRAFALRSCAVHPAGVSDWEKKYFHMKEGGGWLLPDDWEARWETVQNIAEFVTPDSAPPVGKLRQKRE